MLFPHKQLHFSAMRLKTLGGIYCSRDIYLQWRKYKSVILAAKRKQGGSYGLEITRAYLLTSALLLWLPVTLQIEKEISNNKFIVRFLSRKWIDTNF